MYIAVAAVLNFTEAVQGRAIMHKYMHVALSDLWLFLIVIYNSRQDGNFHRIAIIYYNATVLQTCDPERKLCSVKVRKVERCFC